MNHLTSICFIRSDPIFYQAKHKGGKGRAVAILTPSEGMTMVNSKVNRETPKPKIYAIAEDGTQACTEMLKAKRGDFVNVFGELYVDTFATTNGGIGTRLIVKVYHIVVKPNKRMRELCLQHDADAEKNISEIINELGLNDPPKDAIEDI